MYDNIFSYSSLKVEIDKIPLNLNREVLSFYFKSLLLTK